MSVAKPNRGKHHKTSPSRPTIVLSPAGRYLTAASVVVLFVGGGLDIPLLSLWGTVLSGMVLTAWPLTYSVSAEVKEPTATDSITAPLSSAISQPVSAGQLSVTI